MQAIKMNGTLSYYYLGIIKIKKSNEQVDLPKIQINRHLFCFYLDKQNILC